MNALSERKPNVRYMPIGKSSRCEQLVQFDFVWKMRSCITSWTLRVSNEGLAKIGKSFYVEVSHEQVVAETAVV